MRNALLACAMLTFLAGCGDKGKDGKEGGDSQSYSFRSAAKVQLKSTGGSGLGMTTLLPPMCVDSLCITPSTVSGIYYGAGIMIQSAGNGMMAYFGQESWSGTTGASPSSPFDFAAPGTQTGELICCVGEGDLASENTYISDAVYLFGYLDASFVVEAASGARGDAVGSHNVRFVLADGAVTGAKRGDLLYADAGTFKWVDAAGALQATRPADALTMDAKVVSWVNPFGTDKGNQTIPMLSASLTPPTGGGVMPVTEAELKTVGRSYTFAFDVSGFITFPTLLKADAGMLDSRATLLSKIHIQGLPHSRYMMSDAGDTTLTIAGP